MSTTWTTEKIVALSPDASSTKNGRGLAGIKHWPILGYNSMALWGECLGSGKTPYRTQIDLTEPAFRCTCPSRKFPCKHGLGLFLLFAEERDVFTQTDPPNWVQEWLDKRSESTQKKQEAKSEKPVDLAAQAKRFAQRELKVRAGLEDLDLFLRDLVRQGLATVQAQPYSYWDRVAARLVDAQAPILAKRIRAIASIPHSGQGWAERLLAELGKLHLLVQGYKRRDVLPEAVQAELRSQVGWTLKQEELLGLTKQPDTAVEVCRDRWRVLGRRVTAEDDLQVQRIWLLGQEIGRSALLLDFAHRSQTLDCSVWPGTVWDGMLAFYPGLYPLRAIIKEREAHEVVWTEMTAEGYISIEDAIAAHGLAMAQNPWLEVFPMLLTEVIPTMEGEECWLVDGKGAIMLLDPNFQKKWTFMALSGGHAVQLFGEWDGHTLMPLNIGVEGDWISMEGL
jgi:SWIM zinc finger